MAFNLQKLLEEVQAAGTSEGAIKGWDTRGRGTKVLYHVTHTRLVPKIQKQGLRPMQTSNWVRSGNKARYGSGEVYTFTHPEDAVRWAAKMDWSHNQETGSGKISILKVTPANEQWKIDENDPLSHAAAKGVWLKYMGHIPASQIQNAIPVTHDLIRKMTSGGGIDSLESARDRKATYPEDHVAGMRVPKGGSSCASCPG